MINIRTLKTARTVTGTVQNVAGYVLRNEKTGQREWIEDISLAGVCRILRRRTGKWTASAFGIEDGEVVIYA